MERALYSADVVAALGDADRGARLASLEVELVDRMGVTSTRDDFFARSQDVVNELRSLGHDLWSFDADGAEFEIWCGDYAAEGGGTPLVITFRYPNVVTVEWSTRRAAG
jgi:hypothetical protein